MNSFAEHGANIFCKNRQNVDVLHLAVMKNYVDIVKMLVESEFPLNNKTDDGMTPLQLAAALCHTKIASIIIDEITGGSYKRSYINEIISGLNPRTNMSALSLAILSGD